MSRTRKGSKAPGWEPWSHRDERQKPAPDYPDFRLEELEEEEEMFITVQEVLQGRDAEYPLTPESKKNLDKLLSAVNRLRAFYGKPMIVTSGYRPGKYNKAAGGAGRSCHLTCEAVDFADADGKLKEWCSTNLDKLEACQLYMEHPANTPSWVHLQIRPTKSRIFKP